MRYNFFNFKQFGDRILLTNDLGKYLFVDPAEFKQIISKSVTADSDLGQRLLKSDMAYVETDLEYSLLRSYDLRQIKGFEGVATSLHIFVVTTACNADCVYCQARNPLGHGVLRMSKEVAERSVDVALQSPARFLTFEFQGGEPLLNYDVIKHIVLYSEENKGMHEIEFNIVTNLTLLTDAMLDFLAEHNVGISTSLDGPESLHDANRPLREGAGTYSSSVAAIKRVRKNGLHIGAIQTTTRASLMRPREIVNSYIDLGFNSIFVRPLTPLGKARANWSSIGYSAEEFVLFYERLIEEIVVANENGHFLKEEYAAVLVSRVKGEFVNYMELRSPCGAAVGQLAYYPDGKVFTCDEGRMVYEMGDAAFCLGDVFSNTYHEMLQDGVCRTVCAASTLESIPSCCDCVYQPYCGACPVVSYASGKDVIEKEPRGYRCKIYSGMLDVLFRVLSGGDEKAAAIIESWGN